jgi:hypothetical protein
MIAHLAIYASRVIEWLEKHMASSVKIAVTLLTLGRIDGYEG